MPRHGLDLDPLAAPLLDPWAVPLGVDHKQVRDMKEVIDLQHVHSLNQGLPLAKGKGSISCSGSES